MRQPEPLWKLIEKWKTLTVAVFPDRQERPLTGAEKDIAEILANQLAEALKQHTQFVLAPRSDQIDDFVVIEDILGVPAEIMEKP